MKRRFGKHNIVGSEVGRTLQFEFSRRRWKRPRPYRSRLAAWSAALAAILAVMAVAELLTPS